MIIYATTETKSNAPNKKYVWHAKERFTGIADMVICEFQGHYVPLGTDWQINSADIAPIIVMPTPQDQELTALNDGAHYLTQIFNM